jgi:hypothetical protein
VPAKTGAVLRPEDYSCYLLSSCHGSDAAHSLFAVTALVVMAGLLISTSQHHASFEQCLGKTQSQGGGGKDQSLFSGISEYRIEGRMKELVKETTYMIMAYSVLHRCLTLSRDKWLSGDNKMW